MRTQNRVHPSSIKEILQMKTVQDVKKELSHSGITAAAWAKAHAVNPETVRGLLLGRIKGRNGDAHKVAVLLGLKDGEIVECGNV
jgi:gp16 family phage-associated protein